MSIGKIGWTDLTVENATEVRDFYKSVVGMESTDHPMGDFADYNMIPAGETDPCCGICHKVGDNANIPSQWLIYFIVEDVAASLDRAVSLGGKVICPLRKMGGGDFAVIQDPAGAVCALYRS